MSEQDRPETAAQQAQAAQQATESVRTIVQEKKTAQGLADQKREDLQSYLFHETLDRDARFNRERSRVEADLRDRDAGFTQQRKDELQQISDRLQAEGLQKLARDIAGRTAQDQLEKENLEKTIANAEMRAAEERGALEHQQQAERDADQESHRTREAAFDLKLTVDVAAQEQAAREQAAQRALDQAWHRAPAQEQQLQETVAPEWDRASSPEQKNIDPVLTSADDFNAAAIPSPQRDENGHMNDAFNTAAVPSPDDQSHYPEAYERFSADPDTTPAQEQSQPVDRGRD